MNKNVRENFRTDYIHDSSPELGLLIYNLYTLLEIKAQKEGDATELELVRDMKKKYEIFSPTIQKKKNKSKMLLYVSIGLLILLVIFLFVFLLKPKK